MKRIIAATLTFIATPAFAGDDVLICTFLLRSGDKVGYAFGANTRGTVVERLYRKNGKTVVSDLGERPVWRIRSNPITLIPNATPNWKIVVVGSSTALLSHNSNVIGKGNCEAHDLNASTEDKGL